MMKWLVEFRFSVHWLRWLIYAAFFLIVLYVLVPQWHDPLVYIAAVLGGVGVLISALNEIQARAEDIEQIKIQNANLRTQMAFDTIRQWNDPQWSAIKSNCKKLMRAFAEANNVKEAVAAGEQESKDGKGPPLHDLTNILNFFEAVSVQVQLEKIDEEVLVRFFRSIFLGYWQLSKPWIDYRRAERNNSRLYSEIEKLHERWRTK